MPANKLPWRLTCQNEWFPSQWVRGTYMWTLMPTSSSPLLEIAVPGNNGNSTGQKNARLAMAIVQLRIKGGLELPVYISFNVVASTMLGHLSCMSHLAWQTGKQYNKFETMVMWRGVTKCNGWQASIKMGYVSVKYSKDAKTLSTCSLMGSHKFNLMPD